jgi:phosphoglycerate dehydrogenase-like enzyme
VTILVSILSGFRMWTIPDAHVEGLRREFPADTILHAADDDQTRELIEEAEIAFAAYITPDQLRAARRLQWVHCPAAGVGHMLYPEMVASGVTITNGRGTSADTIAEHVLAVVLALFRRLPVAHTRQTQHAWAQDEIASPPGNRTIAGSRVLIVGLGSIGVATATRLTALGATVSGVRRRREAAPVPSVQSVHPPEALRQLLPEADVVVLAAPQTMTTRGLIGEAELARMKRDAVLVNVSRGSLIDEDALVRALRSGALAGAALDVFRDEPLGPDDPMWDVPNLLITPHVSGFRPDHWDAAAALFAENRRRFAAGEPLLNVVDKRAGY